MADRFERHLLTLDRINGKCRCPRSLQGRNIRDLEIDRRPHDLVMILAGLAILRCVYDEAYLTMVHHIKHIWGSLLHFPDKMRFNTRFIEIIHSTFCPVQGETEITQAPGYRDHFIFLADIYRDENIALEWQ